MKFGGGEGFQDRLPYVLLLEADAGQQRFPREAADGFNSEEIDGITSECG